jgi:hypothetical protein
VAVIDRGGKLGLRMLSDREKYDILAKTLYIRGKPELTGPLAVRMVDSIMIRAFSMLFNLGRKATIEEEEYRRLTGNFKRIGNIARRLKFLGPVNRLLLRTVMRLTVNMLGRQKLFGLDNEKTNVRIAAARYFIATDLFDFRIEVDDVEDERVKFRFLECPIGYVSGDDMKICMATNKWDRQCVRMMGVRMFIVDLIPEGSPACRAHIVPEKEKVPEKWRRYTRFTI